MTFFSKRCSVNKVVQYRIKTPGEWGNKRLYVEETKHSKILLSLAVLSLGMYRLQGALMNLSRVHAISFSIARLHGWYHQPKSRWNHLCWALDVDGVDCKLHLFEWFPSNSWLFSFLLELLTNSVQQFFFSAQWQKKISNPKAVYNFFEINLSEKTNKQTKKQKRCFSKLISPGNFLFSFWMPPHPLYYHSLQKQK